MGFRNIPSLSSPTAPLLSSLILLLSPRVFRCSRQRPPKAVPTDQLINIAHVSRTDHKMTSKATASVVRESDSDDSRLRKGNAANEPLVLVGDKTANVSSKTTGDGEAPSSPSDSEDTKFLKGHPVIETGDSTSANHLHAAY